MTRLISLAAAFALAVPVRAQTDPSGEWRTWRTDHFRVHAHPGLRDLAIQAAREAERAYDLLAAELAEPRGPIDLVLHQNVDFPNGFTTIIPANRINVYAVPPAGLPDLASYDDWLRIVITHELTHVFHLDAATGVWGVLQSVFGRGPLLFPNVYQPSWVSEGLATYYESRLTRGGRVRGHLHDQLLAATADSDRWPQARDANLVSPRWPDGLRPYAWGSRFFVLQAGAGDSVIPGFVRHSSRQVIAINTSAPLKAAGGRGVDAAWRDLRSMARAPGSHSGAVVVGGLRSEPHPRLSPSGAYLAYRHDDGRADTRVVVLAADDHREVVSRLVNAGADFAWAGDTLYLTQFDYQSPVEIRSDLYRWAPDGRFARLTHGARIARPFAFPDGRVGVVDIGSGSRELLVTADGGRSFDRFATPAADAWDRVAVSPGGEWAAGVRHRRGVWDLVAWPMGHPEKEKTLTSSAALDADPAWDADGHRIYFASEIEGLPQIYATAVSGGLEKLTGEPAGAREPEPGKGILYYSTMLADGYAVMVVRGPTLRQPAPRRSPPGTPPPPPAEPPPVAVREGPYSPWPGLVPTFWQPVGHKEGPSTGVFLGGATRGIDPLGRTEYSFGVAAAPSNGRWEIAFGLQHARWRAVTLDMGGHQIWDFIGYATADDGSRVPLAERERLFRAGVTWRWRRWRSSVALRLGGEVEEETFVIDDPAPLSQDLARPWLAGGVLTLDARYFRAPPLAISPEDGVALQGLYRRRWRLAGSGWSDELRGAVSGYGAVPLPGFAHWVVAARVSAGVMGGPFPSTFSVGGESGDPFGVAPGVGVGSGRRAFPLRGYPRGGGFTRAFSATAELRVPLVLVAKGIWKLPLGIDRISMTPFVDVGRGWTAEQSADLARLRNVGAEAVFDLAVAHDIPLRLRVGAAVPLTDGLGVTRGDARWYLTAGPSF